MQWALNCCTAFMSSMVDEYSIVSNSKQCLVRIGLLKTGIMHITCFGIG